MRSFLISFRLFNIFTVILLGRLFECYKISDSRNSHFAPLCYRTLQQTAQNLCQKPLHPLYPWQTACGLTTCLVTRAWEETAWTSSDLWTLQHSGQTPPGRSHHTKFERWAPSSFKFNRIIIKMALFYLQVIFNLSFLCVCYCVMLILSISHEYLQVVSLSKVCYI